VPINHRLAAALCACVGLSACGGSGVSSVPPTHGVEITAFRPLAACAAGIRVPASTTNATPSIKLPPTVVLRDGAAVVLAAPAATRLGLSGPATADEKSVVCVARTGGRLVLVAGQPGYVRVVLRTETKLLGLVLVRVTS
jgi:hypothetical protein